eukprot:GHVL01033633.1.p1 GENE.GHVL01033633.1~~GHVL01033633.1.p1  ORF type:complete len:1152 (-),score=211.97 GHVL01033633.1:46-3501(-)
MTSGRCLSVIGRIHPSVNTPFGEEYSHFYSGECQNEICGALAAKQLQESLNGNNTCCFLYGATKSGKSMTLFGSPDEPGVIFSTLMRLKEHQINVSGEVKIRIAISFVEIVNNMLCDLFSTDEVPTELHSITHPVLGVIPPEACHEVMESITAAEQLFDFALKKKSFSKLRLEQKSSRNRGEFAVNIIVHQMFSDGSPDILARMTLLELAACGPIGPTREPSVYTISDIGLVCNRFLLPEAFAYNETNIMIATTLGSADTMKSIDFARRLTDVPPVARLGQSEINSTIDAFSKSWNLMAESSKTRDALRKEWIKKSKIVDKAHICLRKIDEEYYLTGKVAYELPYMVTLGSADDCDLRVNGLKMKSLHCTFITSDGVEMVIHREAHVVRNGHIVEPNSRIKLDFGDRLMFGEAAAFYLSRGEEEIPSFEDALRDEIVSLKFPEHASNVMESLNDEEKVEFNDRFEKLMRYVNDANSISSEIRPHDGFLFTIECLQDGSDARHGRDLAVRVWNKGGVKWIWETDKLYDRLQSMRGMYDSWKAGIPCESSPIWDPWLEVMHQDLPNHWVYLPHAYRGDFGHLLQKLPLTETVDRSGTTVTSNNLAENPGSSVLTTCGSFRRAESSIEEAPNMHIEVTKYIDEEKPNSNVYLSPMKGSRRQTLVSPKSGHNPPPSLSSSVYVVTPPLVINPPPSLTQSVASVVTPPVVINPPPSLTYSVASAPTRFTNPSPSYSLTFPPSSHPTYMTTPPAPRAFTPISNFSEKPFTMKVSLHIPTNLTNLPNPSKPVRSQSQMSKTALTIPSQRFDTTNDILRMNPNRQPNPHYRDKNTGSFYRGNPGALYRDNCPNDLYRGNTSILHQGIPNAANQNPSAVYRGSPRYDTASLYRGSPRYVDTGALYRGSPVTEPSRKMSYRSFHGSSNIYNENAQPGSNLMQTGSNLMQSGSNLMQTGSNLMQSGSNLMQPGSNLMQSGSNLMQPGSHLTIPSINSLTDAQSDRSKTNANYSHSLAHSLATSFGEVVQIAVCDAATSTVESEKVDMATSPIGSDAGDENDEDVFNLCRPSEFIWQRTKSLDTMVEVAEKDDLLSGVQDRGDDLDGVILPLPPSLVTGKFASNHSINATEKLKQYSDASLLQPIRGLSRSKDKRSESAKRRR